LADFIGEKRQNRKEIKPLKYTLRELKGGDISSLHRMYDSLSEESKLFFHPGFLGLNYISLGWLVAQPKLFLSAIKPSRRLLLKVFHRFIFLLLVAVNEKEEVLGFAYLDIRRQLHDGRFLAVLGTGIEDSYQGMGLGSGLMEELIKLGREENVGEITLTVLSCNIRAINMYMKYGFKQLGTVKDGDFWMGNKYDYIEMELYLS